jgi:hypothetical protein
MKWTESCWVIGGGVGKGKEEIQGVRWLKYNIITGEMLWWNPWTLNIHLHKGQKSKTVPVGGVETNGERGEEIKEGWIWLMYFIYLYENRTMKPVEIILSRREEDEGEWWWGWT